MELIKRLVLENGNLDHFSLFKCPECNQAVKRDHHGGVKSKTCGCAGRASIDKNSENLVYIGQLPPVRNDKGKVVYSQGIFYCRHCGKHTIKSFISAKTSKSCGCKWHSWGHGDAGAGDDRSRIYRVWNLMTQRCSNPNNTNYSYYGGRGIIVNEEWKNFVNFKEWALKNGYSDSLEIDRIDNDGDYTPDNCHFVSKAQNIRNNSHTVITWKHAHLIRVFHGTGMFTHKRLSEIFGCSKAVINQVVNYKTWRDK